MQLHTFWHLRQDYINRTRELPSCVINVCDTVMKHMNYIYIYMVKTKDLGVLITPDNPSSWDRT